MIGLSLYSTLLDEVVIKACRSVRAPIINLSDEVLITTSKPESGDSESHADVPIPSAFGTRNCSSTLLEVFTTVDELLVVTPVVILPLVRLLVLTNLPEFFAAIFVVVEDRAVGAVAFFLFEELLLDLVPTFGSAICDGGI